MTSSAQLGNGLVAANESARAAKATTSSITPVRGAVGTRRGPTPPAPVPPVLLPPTASAPQGSPVATPVPAHPSMSRASRAGKLAAAGTVTLIVIAGLGWLGQRPDPAIPQRTAVVRVGAGETIWDVAARVAPQSAPRAVVDRIRKLNDLADTEVAPDQQLRVPDGR
jgi:LysM domain